MADRPTLITSVRRALHLLDAVGAAGRPVTAKALARATGEPLPTTYHLLRTLVHEGYLHRFEGGYVLGARVATLTAAAVADAGSPRAVRERVRPALSVLHEDVGAAAYLAVYDGGEVRLVDVVDSPTTPRVNLWVDLDVAGHATALGKAVLSALDEDARGEYLSRHDLADLTPYTLTDRRSLEQLARTPSRLVVDRQEYTLGIACVATPLRVGDAVGAVAVSAPVPRLDRLVDHAVDLRRTARLVALELASG